MVHHFPQKLGVNGGKPPQSRYAKSSLLSLINFFFSDMILVVVLDRYSAPLTTRNIAKLVIDGAYDRTRLSCTEQAVLTDSGLD
ncbi:hypothetical protein Patl1_37564 [Pistacia atlantica]|nr:hypothetical protein Patl1_37564 [Pistacia atlantica]